MSTSSSSLTANSIRKQTSHQDLPDLSATRLSSGNHRFEFEQRQWIHRFCSASQLDTSVTKVGSKPLSNNTNMTVTSIPLGYLPGHAGFCQCAGYEQASSDSQAQGGLLAVCSRL